MFLSFIFPYFYFLPSWAIVGTRQDLQHLCLQPSFAYKAPVSTLATAFATKLGQT